MYQIGLGANFVVDLFLGEGIQDAATQAGAGGPRPRRPALAAGRLTVALTARERVRTESGHDARIMTLIVDGKV